MPFSSAAPLAVTSWRFLIGFLPVLRYWKMSFDARKRGRRDILDTAARCAAAKVNRILSCLRSLTVALSQQARLMLSDHHDRRHPCLSSRVCVSLKPDQPCQHPEARCVRLKIISLTGWLPVAAKIEVNRSALVHVRGASPRAHKRATGRRACCGKLRDRQLQTLQHQRSTGTRCGLLKVC